MVDAGSLEFPVLLGSVRSDRKGIRAARCIIGELQRRGHRPSLVDPLVLQLPLLDRMYKEYPSGQAPEVLQRLAELYRAADGFVIVSGEYNNCIQPAMKNLLDHFLEEYYWRPSAIVCYSAGPFGGVRAAMQLRMTLAELGMPSIPSLLPIPRIGSALQEDGSPADPARFGRHVGRFLDEFCWYAEALKERRARVRAGTDQGNFPSRYSTWRSSRWPAGTPGWSKLAIGSSRMPSFSITRRDGAFTAAVKATSSDRPKRAKPSAAAARAASGA